LPEAFATGGGEGETAETEGEELGKDATAAETLAAAAAAAAEDAEEDSAALA